MCCFHSNQKPLKALEQGNLRIRASLNSGKGPYEIFRDWEIVCANFKKQKKYYEHWFMVLDSNEFAANKNNCSQMIPQASAETVLRRKLKFYKLYYSAIKNR